MLHSELAGGSAKLLSSRDLAPISVECPTRSACSTAVTIGSTDRKETPCARLFFLIAITGLCAIIYALLPKTALPKGCKLQISATIQPSGIAG